MLVVFAVMLIPPVRQKLSGLSVIVFGLVGLFGIVAFGVLLIRRSDKCSQTTDRTLTSLDAALPFSLAKAGQNFPNEPKDITQQLHRIDWFQFEKLVCVAYRKLGYNVARRGGANPDGGIDLTIEKNGQETAIQCKHWKTWKVGVKAIREFLGAMTHADIQHGIFITMRGYTSEAKQLAAQHNIEIVDAVGLAKFLADTDAKNDLEVLALLKDDQKFCPRCEAKMVLRKATKGPTSSEQFWGCSNFSAHRRCRFTMPA